MKLHYVAAGTLAVALMSNAALAGPSMTVGWLDTKLSQDGCRSLASNMMKGAGLTKNFEVVGDSIFGETGDYTASIRCVAPKAIVLFVTAGPSDKRTSEINKKLKDTFDAGQQKQQSQEAPAPDSSQSATGKQ